MKNKKIIHHFAGCDVIKGVLISTSNLHSGIGKKFFVCKNISHLSRCIMGYLFSFEACCKVIVNKTMAWSLMITLFGECRNNYITRILNPSKVFISWSFIHFFLPFFFSFSSPAVGNFQVVDDLSGINFVSQNLEKLKNPRSIFWVIHLFIVR